MLHAERRSSLGKRRFLAQKRPPYYSFGYMYLARGMTGRSTRDEHNSYKLIGRWRGVALFAF